MYILEYFIKWLNKNKRGKSANPEQVLKEDFTEPEDEAINCNHKFMPVDSTGMVLACTKCGYVIKKRQSQKPKD